MVREARAAYRRRDEEIQQRRDQAYSNGQAGITEPGARRAEWWESVVGVDGAMSPVREESNPLEREGGIVFNEEAFSDGGNTLKGSETKASKASRELEDEKAPDDMDGSTSSNASTPVLETPVEKSAPKERESEMDEKRI